MISLCMLEVVAAYVVYLMLSIGTYCDIGIANKRHIGVHI